MSFKAIWVGLLSLTLVFSGFSQKQTNTWYFGNNAGLNFNDGSPVPLTNGAMAAIEGCAVISSAKTGQLLFYTDGETVWNQNHAIMPNGTWLLGYRSCTQSAVIVPDICDTNLYYIFTSDGVTFDPQTNRNDFPNDSVFCYSTVDMSLNGGLGDVVLKNIYLFSPVNETVTAVKHSNGLYTWVVAHEHVSDRFYAYLVTETGVQGPVISSGGGIVQQNFPVSHIKFAPTGNRIGFGQSEMEIFDFDNTTGIVSPNPINLGSGSGAYGFAISPNGDVLYVSHGQYNLLQYDLTAGTSAQVIATRDTIYTNWFNNYFGWAIQCAPDGKMYITKDFLYGDSLGVINNPNVLGSGCNYDNIGLWLGGPTSENGMPNFIESYFDTNWIAQISQPLIADFTIDTVCLGDTTSFFNWSSGSYLNVQWDFGDNTTDTITNPMHEYGSSGTYTVTLIIDNCGDADTITKTVIIDSLPSVFAQMDTSICLGESVQLNASGASNYSWTPASSLDNSTISNPIATPTSTTTYYITGSNGNCNGMDSVTVIVNPLPVVTAGNSTTIEVGESVQIFATGGGTYSWSPSGSLSCDDCSNPTASPDQTTTYYVTVTDVNGCTGIDSVIIIVNDPAPLPIDTSLYIPNIFSPNADNNNDIFYIRGTGIETIEFVIYDRWGNKIFESIDINQGWDGTYHKKKVGSGVFVYYVKAIFNNQAEVVKKGNITLIR